MDEKRSHAHWECDRVEEQWNLPMGALVRCWGPVLIFRQRVVLRILDFDLIALFLASLFEKINECNKSHQQAMKRQIIPNHLAMHE